MTFNSILSLVYELNTCVCFIVVLEFSLFLLTWLNVRIDPKETSKSFGQLPLTINLEKMLKIMVFSGF